MSASSSASTVYAAMIPSNRIPRLLTLRTKPETIPSDSTPEPNMKERNFTSSSNISQASSSSTLGPTSSLHGQKSSQDLLTSKSLTTVESLKYEPTASLTASVSSQPSVTSTRPSQLRHESECLLNNPPWNQNPIQSREATIFDLRFEDRQRVASLIADLANAEEQVTVLQSRIDQEGERFREEYDRQVELIKELTQRCEILSSHHYHPHSSNNSSCTKISEHEMNKLKTENRHLRMKLTLLEKENAEFKSNLETLEKKYVKTTEDNKRLKWILRTIQQREEILLQNKCHASDEDRMGQDDESPSNIVILKDGKNESLLSSQPPYGTERNDQFRNNRECSTSTVPEKQNYGRLPPSGGDFHEFPVYEPHLVIPPMNSPVIMKIPRSPIMQPPHSQHRPQISYSDPYHHRHPKAPTRVNPTRSNPEDVRTPTTEDVTNEEEILRELFFTF